MIQGRRLTWMLGLLVGLSLALSLLPVVWAGPDQNEARQTVPTATSVPQHNDDDDDDDDDVASTPTVVAVPGALPAAAATAVTASAEVGGTAPVLLPVSGGYASGWGWAVLGSLGAFLLVLVGVAEKRPH